MADDCRLNPERVAACRAVLSGVYDDIASIADEEVIERAEALDGDFRKIGEFTGSDQPLLGPKHLPPLDLPTAADLTALEAELRLALETGCEH